MSNAESSQIADKKDTLLAKSLFSWTLDAKLAIEKELPMDELRINSADGDHLILESQDGTKHRLLVDESLRNAIRSAGAQSKSELSLSPREIQSAIRSGSSVDELVAKSGDPRDYVEKFAQPVIDELTHVLASALGVRISVAGDRSSDISQTEFGEIIASRLIASGVTGHSWATFRDESHNWRIVVQYELNEAAQSGIWSFDLKKLLLSPENENAIALSTQNQLSNPIKLKPVQPTVEQDLIVSLTDTAALPDTQKLETVIPIGRASDRVQTEKPAVDSKIADSNNLLDALKRKREERANESIATQTIDVVVDSVEEEPEPLPTPAPIRRSGRPSIPSFDEIVQGTKSEEE